MESQGVGHDLVTEQQQQSMTGALPLWRVPSVWYEVVKESIPRQVDKKSGVPEEERGVWGSQRGDKGLEFSRRRKGQIFFPPTFLSKDFITTIYPA